MVTHHPYPLTRDEGEVKLYPLGSHTDGGLCSKRKEGIKEKECNGKCRDYSLFQSALFLEFRAYHRAISPCTALAPPQGSPLQRAGPLS